MEKFTANRWSSVLPKGWQDRSMITLISSEVSSNFAPNIVVTSESVPQNVSLRDYVEAQKRTLVNEMPGLVIMDERETTINGTETSQFLQRFPVENQVVQQLQTFVRGSGEIYCITGTAAAEDFGNVVNAFKVFTEKFEIQR